MPLTITSDLITSDSTAHTARRAPGRPHTWQVTWLPGRLIDRNTAITAMVLADVAASDPHPQHRIWPAICSWAAELDLTAPQAIALASQPPGKSTGKEPAATTPDREATGP
jgi:hypothetical protein